LEVPLRNLLISKAYLWNNGRTIRKVMGGVGKKTKKIHASENAKKKIRAKKVVKKKIHVEGRSNCAFYLTYKIYQCL